MHRVCRNSLILLAAFVALLSSAAGQDKSCLADVFVLDSLSKHPQVISPDGRLRLVLGLNSDVGSLKVYAGSKLLGDIDLENLSAGIFLKWAPDSRAFYVMWSDGGMIGGYSVRVFRVAGDTVTEVPAIRKAEQDFRSKHECPRGINVFAVKWENGSNALLIKTQVYPTGDCGKEMGFTAGYLVLTTDGTILGRLSKSQINAEMKYCPSKFWPEAFWDDKELQAAKAHFAE